MKSTIRSDVVEEDKGSDEADGEHEVDGEDEADGEDVEEEVDETDGEYVAEEVEEAGVAGADALDEAEEGDAGGFLGEDLHRFRLYVYVHFLLNL